MRSASRTIIVVASAVAALASAQVPQVRVGTSPNPVGSGARAIGQGSAFIAVADDATAASWNPAGLAQLEEPEFSFAVEAMQRRGELASSSHPEVDSEDRLNLRDLNYASFVLPLNLGRHAALSLSYLNLYRFETSASFPYISTPPGMTITSNYSKLEQQGSFAVLAPALGVDVSDKLSLGLTVNLWDHDLTGNSRFTNEMRATHVFDFGFFQQTQSVFSQETYEIESGISYVLGGLYRLNRNWAFGAVLKPAFELDMGRESVRIANGARSSLKRDGQLEFPWVVGVGTAWRPSDPLTLSLDLTWTQWSEFSYDEPGGGSEDVNPLTGQPISTSENDDVYTCRFGAEYLVIRPRFVVPLRCGLGYDPSPAVGSVDDFYTASIGTGLQWGRFMADIAYELRWGNDVNSDRYGVLREDVMQHRVLASLIVYF